jgi:site-specific DNA-cytosine methylase
MKQAHEIRVLIACEESQAVCKAFRELSFNAFSCDIQECSGGHPEWHYQRDIFEVINMGWDVMIAFPPCTHLAVSGAAWFEQKQKDGRQQQGIDFFLQIAKAKIKHIAIENPIGIMSKKYMPPTQIIQPYYFGDKAQKTTCFWLKNLPSLYHNATPNLFDDVVTHTEKGEFFEWIDSKTGKKKRQPLWFKEARSLKGNERSKIRSKTFPGIAQAMANQWGKYLLETL